MQRRQLALATLATLGTILATDGLTSRPAVGQNLDLGVFQDTALSEHNAVRSSHQAPALTISDSLQNTAQAYAETLASTGVFQHSDREERNNAGENLYYSLSGGTVDPAEIAAQAVQAWYSEESDYDYSNPGFGMNTGHFTQVVWKSTTQLGCGVAQAPRTYAGRNVTATYVVCQYNPAGNMMGDFPGNVLQP